MGKYKTRGDERKTEDNGKALKEIFQLPVKARHAGVITETEVWKAE